MKKNGRFNLRLSESKKAALLEMARIRKKSASEIIREYIERELSHSTKEGQLSN